MTATVSETRSLSDATATEPSGPAIPEAEAVAGSADTLRAFNRAANLGKIEDACQSYFSEAMLARIETESDCVTTVAGVRAGTGKIEMDVQAGSGFVSGETASVSVFMGEMAVSHLRFIDLVFENGGWKIDSVTDPYQHPVSPGSA